MNRERALQHAAKVCRDTYCGIIPGKRTWAELSENEREVDAHCIDAAFRAFDAGREAAAQEMHEAISEYLALADSVTKMKPLNQRAVRQSRARLRSAAAAYQQKEEPGK